MVEFFEVVDASGATGIGLRVEGVFQEYDPDEAGFVLMTRERAESVAAQLLARLVA